MNKNNNNLILGVNKHFTPAIKEWSNSVYSYNKDTHNLINKNIISKLIRDFFNIYNIKKGIKSKRVRKLIIYKSLNKSFVNNSIIKHNNDNILLDIFVYKKNYKSNIRNLYISNSNINFYKQWLLEHNAYKNSIINTKYNFYTKDISNISNIFKYKYKYLYYKKNNLFNIIKKKQYINKFFILNNWTLGEYKNLLKQRKIININFPYYNNINEKNILLYKSLSKKNLHIKYIQKLFLYYFLVSILKIFNITIDIFKSNNIQVLLYNEKKILNIYYLSLTNSIDLLYKINFILWNTLLKINKFNEIKIKNLFKIFYFNHYDKVYNYTIKKNILNSLVYIDYIVNTFKSGKYLYNLKNNIYNLYNKKVDINIINIKYPHLDSSIITNIMSNKLKRQKSAYTKIVGKSLLLSKLPIKFAINKDITNNLDTLNYFKSTKIIDNKINCTNYVLRKIYGEKDLINKENNNYKIKNILNNLKHKWITGIRIETAGRITRRMTAARSTFKCKYKGSLKNKDIRYISDRQVFISTIMLRNYMKSNIQLAQKSSKRKIGSFNIKTWISSY